MKYPAFISVLVLATPAAVDASVFGTGRAKDGDSLMVGATEVRLFGIDAPELNQTCEKDGMDWRCGAASADKLAQLVNGKTVVCSSMGEDQHGRTLGQCMVGATDINRLMVASGFATAYRHYSSDYVSAEESAKVNKRGIWASKFQMPSDYRHTENAATPGRTSTKRSAPKAVSSDWQGRASGSCNIKGNRNRKGQDLPCPWHALLRPDEGGRDVLHRG